MRTQRTEHLSSEAVVSTVLQHTLPEYLASSAQRSIFKKFLCDRIDYNRYPVLMKAGVASVPLP